MICLYARLLKRNLLKYMYTKESWLNMARNMAFCIFVLRVVRSAQYSGAHMWELNNNPRVRSMRAWEELNKKSGKKSVWAALNEWHL